MVEDKYGLPVTEERWTLVDQAIRRFIRKYPLHWDMFKKELHEQQTTFQLAQEGDLKKAGFRNTASFPVVYRRMTIQEKQESPEQDDDLVEVESLYEGLMLLLPGLTEADQKGSPNKLYKEFLRRFPIFRPGEKS